METDMEDIVNEVLPSFSFSEDEAIRRYIELDKQIKSAASERLEYWAFLVQQATEQRNGQGTVHLESSTGSRIKVVFGKDSNVDHLLLEEVREILGPEKFTSLFKTEFTPKAKNLKTFMNTRFADERVTTAQEIIKQAVTETEKRPSVSVEKS